jgi:hypothetical protein
MLGDLEAARRHITAAAAGNPYLNTTLFVDNVNRITRSQVLSAPFVRGLLESGLAAVPAHPPS